MYTAKVLNKEFVNGALKVTVEFTDGTTTVTESCIPQDFNGFKFWVKSRLATFNGGKEVDATFNIDDVVDVTDPIITPEPPTQAELDQQEWLSDYDKWVKVKTTLIDTNVLTGNEPQVQTLLNKVKTNLKPEYLNLL